MTRLLRNLQSSENINNGVCTMVPLYTTTPKYITIDTNVLCGLLEGKVYNSQLPYKPKPKETKKMGNTFWLILSN